MPPTLPPKNGFVFRATRPLANHIDPIEIIVRFFKTYLQNEGKSYRIFGQNENNLIFGPILTLIFF